MTAVLVFAALLGLLGLAVTVHGLRRQTTVVTGWSVEKANRKRDCDGGRHVWRASGWDHSSCVHCGESVPEPVDNLMKPPYTGQRRAR